jgi:hypothetical protein
MFPKGDCKIFGNIFYPLLLVCIISLFQQSATESSNFFQSYMTLPG